MLTMASALMALAAVLLAGGLIGASGIGGVLLVPVLTKLGAVSLPEAIAAASLGFALPALVALGPLCRQRALVGRCIPLLLGALPGAAAGALMVRWLPATALMLGVTLLLLFTGWRGLRSAGTGAEHVQPPGTNTLLALGALVGFGSALTGTGGPVLAIPLLILMRQPVPFAVVAGQAIQFPVALTSSAVHVLEARLDLQLAAICGLLMLIGSIAGQRAAAGLNVRQLQRMVSILLLAVGAWFAWLLLA